ncbi:MAG: branched-chain amino acid ABC transporter permease [Lachnospiraceae bacterium]|nr:branched-chain amino acid ABC transporter permease [Lachnospiraceae bacterium]
MTTFIQTLIVGLRLGSMYALVALGYTMVYGIIRLLNFAHGDFIMVGGYAIIFSVPAVKAMGLPIWVAVFPAIIVCALVGMGTELVAYRPVRKNGTAMSALITAIAMSLFLENLAQAIPAIGPNPKVAPQIFPSSGIKIGKVTLDSSTILTIIIGLAVMLGLYFFIQKTKIGRAMRCVSEDKEAATLMGINVNKTILITFGIGSGLAAVASLMYISAYPKVFTTLGVMLGLKAFVAAVLGGIGIIPGAMLGGIVIGLVESFTMSYISSSLSDAFVFLILIVVLLIKPAGLLGKNVGEKV